MSDGQRYIRGMATVSGDAVTTGTGSVSWTVQGPQGPATVSQSGTSTLVREDGQRPRPGERALWQVKISLPAAGVYLLQVSQPWPGAGSDQPPWTDTKTLIVQS